MSAPATDRPDSALLAELATIVAAVRGGDWRSGEISGSSGQLDASANPLSGLGGAGLDWFTPFIAFLEEPLHQLRADPDQAASGAEGHTGAGQDIAASADGYRRSAAEETDSWTGESGDGYRQSSAQYADGLSALSQGSDAVGGAISGAAEVVAQVADIVVRLVAEAVGTIVPIMSQAVASAPATFGQSVVAAIPRCVQIAVDAGRQIAGKLAALLSSGENLLKLVEGAIAVMGLAKQVLSQISGSSTQSRPQLEGES